ncbi:MAG: HEPN domain-containing protein [Chloroflexi bacterium]|nr:HEPN domain-containing protein [Chloroflexota bacterium]
MKPETQEWLEMAAQDLAAAEILLERDLLPPAVFHTHSAVEKTLKGFWIEQRAEGVPPRTHDLLELLRELHLDLPDWQEYLANLSRQAVVSRYAGTSTYTAPQVTEYLARARELCAQLQQRLT